MAAALKLEPIGGRAIEHGRIFKTEPAPAELDQLRSIVRSALPEPPPSEAELAEREALAESQRAWSSIARGGVYAG